jgi:hypothetical protein
MPALYDFLLLFEPLTRHIHANAEDSRHRHFANFQSGVAARRFDGLDV